MIVSNGLKQVYGLNSVFTHFLSTICLQLCIKSNSIVFHTKELPIIKPLFNSPYSPESHFPIIPVLISSGIHSISQQTNKQTINTSFIYTLCAFRWPHFTISKIPFSYYTSLSPSLSHILIAARLHVLRRQTQQLRPLVSLQHRHQPIVLLRRHLPSTPLPLLPSPRSSAARSWTSATTCTPSSAARSPPPSLPASIPRSDSRTLPAESPSVPPGSVAAAVCVKPRGNPYFCSTEDFLNCMSSSFSFDCRLAAIWSIAEPVSTFLRPIILPCSMRTLSSGRSVSDRCSCNEERTMTKNLVFLHVAL